MRPTCKVYTRPGSSGLARVGPRGCKIRGTADAGGNELTRTSQDGTAKNKVTAHAGHYYCNLSRGGRSETFLWDTGATYTSCGRNLAKKWGLFNASNQPIREYTVTEMRLADGKTRRFHQFDDVDVVCSINGRDYPISITVVVSSRSRASNLFGLQGIRQLPGVKVRFS